MKWIEMEEVMKYNFKFKNHTIYFVEIFILKLDVLKKKKKKFVAHSY